MGLKGMIISGVAAVAGAIMYFATTAQSSYFVATHGFRLSTVGAILILAGIVGFVVSAIIYAVSRHPAPPPPRRIDREVTDERGRQTSLHEERR
jgi:phosphate/sulfate permease